MSNCLYKIVRWLGRPVQDFRWFGPLAQNSFCASKTALASASVLTAVLLLSACAAIEIDRPAQMPRIGPAEDKAAGQSATFDKDSASTLSLTVEDALMLALERNRALQVQRYNPALRTASEDQERAAFDPTLSASYSQSRSRTVRNNGTLNESDSHSRRNTGTVGLSQYLPTGTEWGVDVTGARSWGDGPVKEPYSTAAGLSVTQSLLKGAGLDVNWASVRQARLDTLSSEYELRGYALSLVASVENAYWDHLLAEERVAIYENALDIAERQLADTLERIRVGKLAQSERYAAEAEVAQRREGLISSESTRKRTHLALLRLLDGLGPSSNLRPVDLRSRPVLPEAHHDSLEDQIALALRIRPELNQARLNLKRGELEIVKTRNGLLPALDLFINLGKTGYSDSFAESAGNLNEESYDMQAGARVTYAIGNRAARARNRRAILSRRQAEESLANIEQLAENDVRAARIEEESARAQIDATRATRRLREETMRIEVEKLRVGKSTTLNVAQAQRDFLQSRLSESEALVSYLKAVVNVYQQDGSLLDRRGIVAPGASPVTPEMTTNAALDKDWADTTPPDSPAPEKTSQHKSTTGSTQSAAGAPLSNKP